MYTKRRITTDDLDKWKPPAHDQKCVCRINSRSEGSTSSDSERGHLDLANDYLGQWNLFVVSSYFSIPNRATLFFLTSEKKTF